MSKIATIAGALLIATSTVALADSIDEREARQARAIERGRQDGSITWKEGIKLRAEQRQIQQTESQFRADGHLDRRERRVLNRMLDESAQHVREEARDGQRRPGFLPRVGK